MDSPNTDLTNQTLDKKLDAMIKKNKSIQKKDNDRTFMIAIFVLIAIAIIGAICYFAVGYFASSLN